MGNVQVKGVCTLLISFSLFRRFLCKTQSTALGLHIGLCGCCCSPDTHGTASMSIEHSEWCRTNASSSGCTHSTAHNFTHAAFSRRRGKFIWKLFRFKQLFNISFHHHYYNSLLYLAHCAWSSRQYGTASVLYGGWETVRACPDREVWRLGNTWSTSSIRTPFEW